MSWFEKILGLEPDKLFYPGQEITPISKMEWVSADDNETIRHGPKFGEIVKCVEYVHYRKGEWYIQISGYYHNYAEGWFAPVITDKQLEEMLQEVEITITHGTF